MVLFAESDAEVREMVLIQQIPSLRLELQIDGSLFCPSHNRNSTFSQLIP